MSTVLHDTVDGPADAPVLLLGPSLGTDDRAVGAAGAARSPTGTAWSGTTTAGTAVPGARGPYRIGRSGRRRARAAGPARGRAGARRRRVARRHGRRCGWPRTRPSGSTGWCRLHVGAAHARRRCGGTGAAAVRADGLSAIADAVVARWLPPDYARRPSDAVADCGRCSLATPAEGYAALRRASEVGPGAGPGPDRGADAGRSPARLDEATPPEHAERIAAGIAGARLDAGGRRGPPRGADPAGRRSATLDDGFLRGR